MSDYIEREAALAYPIRKDKCDRKHANKHFILGIESVIEFVEDLPAADVAPVEHGHWNDINPAVLKPGISWVCRCSLCGCPQDYKHNYCPNCGCCMLGGGEDDTVSDKQ